MSEENEQAPDVQEQEDTSVADIDSDADFDSGEETITVAKSKFNAIRRKASAYDANKDKPQKITNTSSDEKWKQRMELRVEGHSDEEVDFLMKNGGKKALDIPFVKAAIESLRTQKVAERAVLANEGEKSSATRGLNPADFAKLSAEDQLKTLSGLN